MSEEQINELLYEIKTDEEGVGFIDCGTATDYMDEHLYERIVTAVKQNIELQKTNKELTQKLEQVEKERIESLLQVEDLLKDKLYLTNDKNDLLEAIRIHFTNNKISSDIRISDYVFHKSKDGTVVYKYDPIKKTEPIELSIEVITPDEHENLNGICPNCQGELGEYPVISRKDKKTMICPGCGMLEALQIWKANNEKQNI